MAKVHILKTLPDVLRATLRGDKTFEFRRDDRDYNVGDILILREWIPDRIVGGLGHWGELEVHVRVTYLLRGPAFEVPPGFVVMSVVRPGSPG